MGAKLINQKPFRIAVLIGLGIVLLGVTYAFTRPTQNTAVKTDEDKFYPKASVSSTPDSTAKTDPTPAPANIKPLPITSQPATSTSGLITVTSPTSGGTISDGTTVSGNAKVSDGKISFRLKGSNSGQLAGGTLAVPGSTTQLSPFSFPIGLTNQVCDANKNCSAGAIDTGVLEVFSISPSNGSEINQASIPVKVKG